MLKKSLQQLWHNEAGGVVSLEIVLVGTILCIGLTTGLASVRDAVITELADIGASIGSMDQGMSIMGSTSASSATASMNFEDGQDMGDSLAAQGNSQCLIICNGGTVQALAGNEDG